MERWDMINEAIEALEQVMGVECSFCEEYGGNDDCKGCPLREVVGMTCFPEGSPYQQFAETFTSFEKAAKEMNTLVIRAEELHGKRSGKKRLLKGDGR